MRSKNSHRVRVGILLMKGQCTRHHCVVIWKKHVYPLTLHAVSFRRVHQFLLSLFRMIQQLDENDNRKKHATIGEGPVSRTSVPKDAFRTTVR